MPDEVQSHDIYCPYCGERFELLVDGSVPHQQYIEDCEICCRPIVLNVTISGAEGHINVVAHCEDD